MNCASVVAGPYRGAVQLEQALRCCRRRRWTRPHGQTAARLYRVRRTLLALGRSGRAPVVLEGRRRANTEGATDAEGRSANWPDLEHLRRGTSIVCCSIWMARSLRATNRPGCGGRLAGAGFGHSMTNNASRVRSGRRPPLNSASRPVRDVLTSAQALASSVSAQLPAGGAVLVVGTDSLAAEIAAVGLHPVRGFDDDRWQWCRGTHRRSGGRTWRRPLWRFRAGALWVATNVEQTLPSGVGCCRAAGRWSPHCAPPPMQGLGWPASRHQL